MNSLDLQTSVPGVSYAGLAIPRPSLVDGVVLRHLRTPAEVASVLHLRDEIDLSVHAAAGRQQFESLEKKETKAAWCSDSSLTARRSAPCASFRWATA